MMWDDVGVSFCWLLGSCIYLTCGCLPILPRIPPSRVDGDFNWTL